MEMREKHAALQRWLDLCRMHRRPCTACHVQHAAAALPQRKMPDEPYLENKDDLMLCQLCCRLTIFLVYNAYPERSKTETWEKRLTCISWMFGCYKTMIQQVEGRQACCSHFIPHHIVHKQVPQTRAYCSAINISSQGYVYHEQCSASHSLQPQQPGDSTVSSAASGVPSCSC